MVGLVGGAAGAALAAYIASRSGLARHLRRLSDVALSASARRPVHGHMSNDEVDALFEDLRRSLEEQAARTSPKDWSPRAGRPRGVVPP